MSVTFKDFEKLSLKVARITAAERIPGLSKIMKVEVDIGERTAQAIAGGGLYYDTKDLLGKQLSSLQTWNRKLLQA